jgi:hypothetical protein
MEARLILPEDEDYELRAEIKRLAEELDAACAQRDQYYALWQRERKARHRFLRLISDGLMAEGSA